MRVKKSFANNVLNCLFVIILLTPSFSLAIQFDNVSNQAGMLHPAESWGSAWGDFDGDNYPDLWNSNHRVKPTLYRNNGDGTFTNIVPQVWSANPKTDAHGSAWADFDRDGDMDLMEQTGGANPNNPNALNQFYLNNNGVLLERAAQFDLDYGAHRGRSVQWFDYNFDGELDLSLSGYTNASGAFPSSIFKQEASGFVDVSNALGFSCPVKSNFSTLADLTGDGVLDLICHSFTFPQKIYDMTTVPFTDITNIMPKTSLVFDSAFADFNGDLQADVVNVRIPNNRSNVAKVDNFEVQARLITNSGRERGFSFATSGDLDIDLTSPSLKGKTIFIGAGGLHPVATNGITRVSMTLSSTNPDHIGIYPHLAGVDNGLFIGYNDQTGKWEVKMSGSNSLWSTFRSANNVSNLTLSGFQPSAGQKLRYYQTTPNGYVNQSNKAGFTTNELCVSISAGDFDNDMDLDFYLVCEHSPLNLPNRLYENVGDSNGDGVVEFVRVPNAGGARGTAVGAGKNVAMADYDVDGFLDLFVSNGHAGGSIPNGPDQMFRNTGNNNNWVEIDLHGQQSNVHGIGARIIATTPDGKSQLREHAAGTHSYTQNHQRIHFGLARNGAVDLHITWPNGHVDIYEDVAVNKLYKATEDQGIEVVDLNNTVPTNGSECGQPNIQSATEKAYFIWKDCISGSNMWFVRATAGGDANGPRYVGTLSSDENFSNVTPFNLENNDTLDFTTNPKQISFNLRMWNISKDGFDFNFPGTADACLNITSLPAGAQVLLGADKTAMPSSFSLQTLQACQ